MLAQIPKPLVGIVVAVLGVAGVFYTLYRAFESTVPVGLFWLACCIGLGIVAVGGVFYGFDDGGGGD